MHLEVIRRRAPASLGVDPKLEPGEHFALTPGFDLALVEEPDGLLVKLLLGTGVLTTSEAFVLIVVVVGLLLHHKIAANHQSRSPEKRLHVAARPQVTGVQQLGKNLVTRVRAVGGSAFNPEVHRSRGASY